MVSEYKVAKMLVKDKKIPYESDAEKSDSLVFNHFINT